MFKKSLFLNIVKLFAVVYLFFSTISFAYTNTFADWYGISYSEPSKCVQTIAEIAGREISIFEKMTFVYSFEMNANPRYPSVLSSGFTFKSTFMNYLPGRDFNYGLFGLSYDIYAKILGIRIGNSSRETVFSFGGSVGADIETLQLLVGQSNDISDLKQNDFKHYNTVQNINLTGLLRLLVQFPLSSRNVNNLLLSMSYYISTALYGPFMPNLELVDTTTNIERATIGYSISLQFQINF
ncbi:MAG: hypothetical protein WHS64_03310 [Fervidobacterium sp.]|uniref:Outer membrane protein beta-barrel domain-containing protein n=1 Tax=Fervidobacterium gondwanense DSM 13020 TaxID=1121883 RepID=A0A1M7S133_FERGO|nr:hypothetical protein [Fervidobacterium gondwanense]UXF00217.1 hypothetical protein IB67_01045 [Fervidobacterium riparium]SHN52188.1 hypothetical protein SAMN02745226_00430 [Fervidobacterium gondwanense DSM 13020]